MKGNVGSCQRLTSQYIRIRRSEYQGQLIRSLSRKAWSEIGQCKQSVICKYNRCTYYNYLILNQFYLLILHTLPGNGSMIPIGMNTAAVAATRFFEMHPLDLLLFFSKVVCVNCTLHIFSINETIIGKNAQTLRYVSNNINVVIRNTADTMYNGRKHITRNIFSLLSTLIFLFSLM